MDIDIGFWLTVIVLLSVALWVADRVLKITPTSMQQKGQSEQAGVERAASSYPRPVVELVEFFNSILPVLLVVLVVRSFLFEPFTIPSGSMLPTLKVHDFILVNKFAYGVRLPAIHTKILETGTPERGDVMVFRYPEMPSQSYIKRVVGLPGDRIRIRGAELFINDVKVERRLVSRSDSQRGQESVYVESLGEAEHLIRHDWLLNPYTGQLVSRSPEGEWQVPDGSYFVMGDNRDNSKDSRFWGFVPESHVAGEAVLIWMHWPSLLSIPDFSRNGAIDKVEKKQ
ncbi:signal peptidase I [Alcanivorax sp. 1008]|uniref:signal peptidase I n=1 Tax=Alcanivorax sp. 1008 TaxID=2816853 RepID=UPI001D7A6405|nr:signal peptidase I [Alcanivorax sp. 1008]MCC1495606.1 signal peptidase I [Alcanivorax sp. 1008]